MSEQHNGAATAHRNLATRRTSLVAIGGAALTTLLHRAPAAEAKKGKKARKQGKKGNKQTRRRTQECPECPEEDPPVEQCVPQEAPCRDFAEQFCAQLYPPGQPTLLCAVAATLCCRDLGVCEGEDVFACLASQLPDD